MDLAITILLSLAVQFLVFLYLRGRIEQQLNATDLLKNVQQEIDAMVRELNLSAERNIGVLEERLGEMEGLLVKADQKVMLLQRELERRDRTAEVYSQMKRVVALEPEVELPAAGPSVVPAPVLPPVAEPGATPKTLKQKVVELGQQGLSAPEIALSTGATQGEVELILSLHRATRPE
jgi:hypothetical protein